MKKIAVFIMMLLLVGMLGVAQADPITVNNGNIWYEFLFGAVGVPSAGGGGVPSSGGNSVFAPNAPWTFTSALPVFFTVVDAFEKGDVFQIFDFGSPVGQTTAVAVDASGSISDPAITITDPTYSRGFFALFAGNHSITIQPTVSPFDGGAAYFRADTHCPCTAPIPGSLILLGSGIMGLAGVGVRRRSA